MATNISLSDQSLRLSVDLPTARALVRHHKEVAAWARQAGRLQVLIDSPSSDRPLRISAAEAAANWREVSIANLLKLVGESVAPAPAPEIPQTLNLDAEIPTVQQLKAVSDRELYQAITGSERSACLTTVAENKIVAANFAVVPSHGKPYHQMIGSDLTPLWDADELARIMSYLDRDGFAPDLEYWTWKWEALPDGSWTRSRQFLSRHAFAVVFDGVKCRLTVGV